MGGQWGAYRSREGEGEEEGKREGKLRGGPGR